MAEPFGIAPDAIEIAAAFTACVDVFEYVQLGRCFGKDYQPSQLKLTLLRLRLSRWGEAVNIYSDPQLGNPTASKAEVQAAKDTILQILLLFDDSSKISKKFKIHDAGSTASDLGKDVDVAVLSANNKMRTLVVKRKKDASLIKLTSWAIHHTTALKTLLNDIKGLVDNLEDLFPASERLKALAREEVANLNSPREIQVIASASKRLDDALYDEASKVTGHQFLNVDINGGKNATMANGNVFVNNWTGEAVSGPLHLYDGIKVKATDGLIIVNGNTYGSDPFSRGR